MKSVIAGCLLLSLSFSSIAKKIDLEQSRVIAGAYYKLGDDNNYLDALMLPSSEFAIFRGKATKVADGALVESLKKCVFMADGMYGEHLNPELQDRIANRFAGLVSSFGSYELDARDFRMSSGDLSAPCVLAVEDTASGQVILMQGAATD